MDEKDRTCPNCGDVMPVGWTLEDHFACNWPEPCVCGADYLSRECLSNGHTRGPRIAEGA